MNEPTGKQVVDAALNLAVSFIAAREDCRLSPYQDQAGVWTIGIGNTYCPDGSPVTKDTPPLPSEQVAYEWFRPIVAKTLYAVRQMVTQPMTPAEAAALTSFAYNEGVNALRSSTLLEKFNDQDVLGASLEFTKWAYVTINGKLVHSAGLLARRKAERKLFLTGKAT